MSVPDHLIDAAARAAYAEPRGHETWINPMRAALEAVADELRAEGARAEREKIAARLEAMAEHAHGKEAHHTGADFAYAAFVVREGGDTNAQ